MVQESAEKVEAEIAQQAHEAVVGEEKERIEKELTVRDAELARLRSFPQDVREALMNSPTGLEFIS